MDDPYAPPQAPSGEPHHAADEGSDLHPLGLTFLFLIPFVAVAVAVGVFMWMYYLQVREILNE